MFETVLWALETMVACVMLRLVVCGVSYVERLIRRYSPPKAPSFSEWYVHVCVVQAVLRSGYVFKPVWCQRNYRNVGTGNDS